VDWLDALADALGVPRLAPAEVEQLLELAGVVAHGTERKNAPLATFLVGRATGAGQDLASARSVVERRAVSPGGS
jgi:hypothetical protein